MSEERSGPEPPLDLDFVDEFAEPRPAPADTPQKSPARRRPSLFWPILLIALGVILLLNQLGLVDLNPWTLVARYWPVLLILAGLDLLLGRRSALGSIIGFMFTLLILAGLASVLFLGRDLPGWLSQAGDAELTHEIIEFPLDDLEQGRVTLNLGSWHTRVDVLEDSRNLIFGEIDTYGVLEFQTETRGDRVDIDLSTRNLNGSGFFGWVGRVEDRWEIALSPDLRLDLKVDCGSGSGEFDLDGLQLSELVVDGGSGSIALVLPSGRSMDVELDVGSGSLDLELPDQGTAQISVDGGTGSIRMELPRGMAARVELESGTGSFHPGERLELVSGDRDGDSIWETEGYEGAESRVTISIDQGTGSISFLDDR